MYEYVILGSLLIIIQDMANPDVRSRIAFYPVESNEGISELCHCQKWLHDLPDDRLTPMWASRGAHFYVGEAAQLANGNIVVPLRWFESHDEMHMAFYAVH